MRNRLGSAIINDLRGRNERDIIGPKSSQNLEKIVQANLGPNERVIIRLKGAFKEALIGTEQSPRSPRTL